MIGAYLVKDSEKIRQKSVRKLSQTLLFEIENFFGWSITYRFSIIQAGFMIKARFQNSKTLFNSLSEQILRTNQFVSKGKIT